MTAHKCAQFTPCFQDLGQSCGWPDIRSFPRLSTMMVYEGVLTVLYFHFQHHGSSAEECPFLRQ